MSIPRKFSSLLALLPLLLLNGCEAVAGTLVAGGLTLWVLGSLLLLALLIYAIIDLVKSSRSSEEKLLWALLIIFMPYLGAIIYLFFGRNAAYK